MRLVRVQIQHFRGIGSLSLELDSVTAVIGENNHGKTSLFDILGLFLGRGHDLARRQIRWDDFHRPDGREIGQNIRVVLTFDATGTPADVVYASAIREDEDGEPQLSVEFIGEAKTRHIRTAFLDPSGRELDGLATEGAVDTLRAQHPVLLLRFAQPAIQLEHGSTDASGDEKRGRRGLEAQIARVYRELTQARGPVPTEELVDGLRAAQALYRKLTTGDSPAHEPMRRMLDQLLDDPGFGRSYDSEPNRIARAGSGSHTLGLLMVLGAVLQGRGDELLPEGATPLIAIEEPEVHLHPILLASTWDVIESLGAQTLVTTNSGELLSSMPMRYLRRLIRRGQKIEVRRLLPHTLDKKERRRVGYHIGAKRGGVLFARCWLLVEGETEFWILRALAHVLGYDLEAEGVRIVEFAQCGIVPLVKLANDLGIEWHLLVDGDHSGNAYALEAEEELDGARPDDRISRLGQRDMERCFWHHGYEAVYRDAARMGARDHRGRRIPPGKVISKAVRVASKPFLALSVAEAVAARGPAGVPPVLRDVIKTSVRLARDAIRDGTEAFDR